MKTLEIVTSFVKKNSLKLFFGIILIVIINAGQLYTIKIMQKTIDSIDREGFTSTSFVVLFLDLAG